MQGENNAGLLGNGYHILQETAKAIPQLIVGYSWQSSLFSAGVVHHIPHHSIRNWSFIDPIHTDRKSLATSKWSRHTRRNSRD